MKRFGLQCIERGRERERKREMAFFTVQKFSYFTYVLSTQFYLTEKEYSETRIRTQGTGLAAALIYLPYFMLGVCIVLPVAIKSIISC